MTIMKKISASLVLSTFAVALIACGKAEQAAPPPPPIVTGKVIHKEEIAINYDYAARIVAYRETDVRARVGGIMLHRNFVEGSEVKQGDVLFEIDPDLYEAQVASARAQVAQAKAKHDQSILDANRAEELLVQRVQSTAQRDQAFATRDANLAALMQAKAELRTAELNLEYTKVTAPISGLTSREAVSEGSLIGTDSTSSLLTTITQRDPVYVNFSFTDSESTEMRRLLAEMKARGEDVSHLQVIVHFGDGTEYSEKGNVDFTSPTVDQQTGTLGARAVIANPNHRLVPGMFVRVTVTGLMMENAYTVPEKALMQTSAGQSVYVLKKSEPSKAEPNDKAAATPPALQAGARLVEVEQRSVVAIRQLQSGDWLLKAPEKYEAEVPVKAQPDDGKKPVAGKEPAAPVMEKVQRVRGVEDGEEVLTSGEVSIDGAMQRTAPGAAIKAQVIDDTGQNKTAGPAQ